MIVVATDPDGIVHVQAGLRAVGAHEREVRAVGGGRLLVLADAGDAWHSDRAVRALQADGLLAVERPDGGVRLDAWHQHTRPVRIGDRLTVCFAWSEHDRDGLPGVVELGLGGFGSGDHPATRMLLDHLVARIRGRERVLDVGCGSGVLGLAALRLGAGSLVAMDVKSAAVEATRRNAAFNGLEGATTAIVAPLDRLDGPFDAILANVGRGVLVELAPQLRRLVAPGGWLAVSGFSPPQCPSVAGFLEPLVEIDRRIDGEWAALALQRPPR